MITEVSSDRVQTFFLDNLPRKTASISWCHGYFPCEMVTSGGLDNVGLVQKDPKLPTTFFLRWVQQCLLSLKLNISLQSLGMGRRQNFCFSFSWLSFALLFFPRFIFCWAITRLCFDGKRFAQKSQGWWNNIYSVKGSTGGQLNKILIEVFVLIFWWLFFLCRVFGVEIIHSCSIFRAAMQG